MGEVGKGVDQLSKFFP